MFGVARVEVKKKMSSCLEKTEIIIQIIIQILTLILAVLAALSDLCSVWRNRRYETTSHNRGLNCNRQVRSQAVTQQSTQSRSSLPRRRSSLPALQFQEITCGPPLRASTPLKSVTPTLSELEDSSFVRLDLSREAI